MGVECELRRGVADELDTGIGEDVQRAVAALADTDVHELGQRIDRRVALIGQRRIGRIGDGVAGELVVEIGDLLHRVVGGRDRLRDAVLGVGPQRLRGRSVMPLSVCARTWALLSTRPRAAAGSGLVTSD